jgi:predicted MFS family arabinose efflux permease
VLVETIDWRACFLINVPIGVAALLLAPKLVPESRATERTPLDLVGVVLVSAAVVAVVVPLIEGRAQGWPLWTWLSFAAALVLLDLFVLHVRRATAPLLDLSLLGNRAFTAGLVAQLLFWCGQAAFFVYLALYLQPGRGLSPIEAGLVFTIVAVTYVMTSAAAPGLTERRGRTVPLVGGLALAAGHGTLALTAGGSLVALAPGLALVGAGMGLCFTALNLLAVEQFDDERAGSASGLLATVQELGNALGVAITGVIFFGALSAGHADAFTLSVIQLAAVGLGVAALTRLLPRRG